MKEGTHKIELKRLFIETVRRTVSVTLPSNLRLEVEVDRTRLPDGHVDDEIEMELPEEALADEVESWLETTAQEAHIEMREAPPKIVRFFACLSSAKP